MSVPKYDNLDEMNRRKLLSQLAKIFEPLRFFSPVITTTKLTLREFGELQIGWDDAVRATDVGSNWWSFQIEMTVLEKVRVPRWIYSVLVCASCPGGSV